MIKFSRERLHHIVDRAKDQKIIVFGDLMVDQYLWGNVTRISPEAPVPVINIASEQVRFGGAANVAFNLLKLGVTPLLIGAVGNDRMGENFYRMMQENSLPMDGVIKIENKPTTVKTRIIGNNQHIARVDQESTEGILAEDQEKLYEVFQKNIEDSEAVLIQDYNKGLIVPQLISHVIGLAEKRDKIVTVDPKFENFFEYKRVTLFKPNTKETEEALAMRIKNDNDVLEAGQKLLQKLGSKAILITRGSKGMALFEKNGEHSFIETKARKTADVSGAGDTVIATITFALCGGADIKEAVTLSNFAAGLVCEEVGVVPINIDKLTTAVLVDK